MDKIPPQAKEIIFKRLCLFEQQSGKDYTICEAHHNLHRDFQANFVERRHCLWPKHVGPRRLAAGMESRSFSVSMAEDLYAIEVEQDEPKIRVPFDGLYCKKCSFLVSDLHIKRRTKITK